MTPETDGSSIGDVFLLVSFVPTREGPRKDVERTITPPEWEPLASGVI